MSAKEEERLVKLVALAIGNTSIDEARNAALLALKLAAKLDFVFGPKANAREPRERRAPRPRSAPARDPSTRPRKQGESFVNRFAQKGGACEKCGGIYAPGEVVASRSGETKTYHASCASQCR